MERVSGIGGVFFRARDPDALARWYAEHLGIDPPPPTYEADTWRQDGGPTVWAPFGAGAGEFGRPEQMWMINFRVRDLSAMVRQLEAAGIIMDVDPEFYSNGRFARIEDPEENPIQLWQPSGRDAGGGVPAEIDLFFRHVERFNAGVRSGDFGPMIEQFDERAELVFQGVPVGPFTGRAAIAAATAQRPPDDEVLALAEPAIIDGAVVAPYGWRSGGGEAAGRMLLTAVDARIRASWSRSRCGTSPTRNVAVAVAAVPQGRTCHTCVPSPTQGPRGELRWLQGACT